jgi:hypothetical protein
MGEGYAQPHTSPKEAIGERGRHKLLLTPPAGPDGDDIQPARMLGLVTNVSPGFPPLSREILEFQFKAIHVLKKVDMRG